MSGEISTKRARSFSHFILVIFVVALTACSENQTPTPQLCDGTGLPLTIPEVTDIVMKAASSLSAANTMTVAVVDRKGRILAVYRNPGATGTDDDLAVSLARTGAFFSNNQAPLSSRTVRFISGIHFPPGISFTGNAALYGIEHTNRGCELNLTFNAGQAVPPAKSVNGLACNATDQSGCGSGITTGKLNFSDSDPNAVNPGGIPIFRGCTVIGGVGIAGVSADLAESAALAAISLFPPSVFSPGVVVVEGIRLPFVKQSPAPAGTAPLGPFFIGPLAGELAPDGYLAGPVGTSTGLTASEVDQIVQQSIAVAGRTRAVIRLPMGLTTRMAIAVSDLNGNILALNRMPDSTIFSIDVAVAKARNVVYFSGSGSTDLPGVPVGTAVTNRTISFGSQPLYPPGIDGTAEGPFFAKLFKDDKIKACSLGSQPSNLNQNGIVFFPGSLPLYKNGVLIGGLGVSGDGVEQDDYVSWHGAQGFQPAEAIHADQVSIGGARLPFIKFPRNPEAR